MPQNYQSAAEEADQRLLSRVATETQVRRQRQALREEAQRSEPITGRAREYDTTTGDWLLSTDQGGTVRAQLNSNGAPLGRVLLGVAPDNQIGEINAPPSDADLSPLVDQINGLSNSLTQLMGARPVDADPNGDPKAIPRYPNEIIRWEGVSYAYDQESDEWVPIGGGGEARIFTGNFDPNQVSFEPEDGAKDGDRFYDQNAKRWLTWLLTGPDDAEWRPDGSKIFTGPVSVAYIGDGYIQPNSEGACFYVRTEEGWLQTGTGCNQPENAGPSGPAPASCPTEGSTQDDCDGDNHFIGNISAASWVIWRKCVSVQVNVGGSGCPPLLVTARRGVGVSEVYALNTATEEWATGRTFPGENITPGATFPDDIQFGTWQYNGGGAGGWQWLG